MFVPIQRVIKSVSLVSLNTMSYGEFNLEKVVKRMTGTCDTKVSGSNLSPCITPMSVKTVREALSRKAYLALVGSCKTCLLLGLPCC